ncbi:MAG TPA: hypothetical protein VJ372_13915 [Pyrinomonadaceae bacterium]|nr:hypothetical protein [Pyrinomonadaceae bacterium]
MRIRNNLNPGDLGYIIQLHGTLYAQEYALDHTFEGYVAAGMGEFAKSFEARKDFVAIAEDDDQIAGPSSSWACPIKLRSCVGFSCTPRRVGRDLGKNFWMPPSTFAAIEDSSQYVSGQLAN